jgi:hypothetical protein
MSTIPRFAAIFQEMIGEGMPEAPNPTDEDSRQAAKIEDERAALTSEIMAKAAELRELKQNLIGMGGQLPGQDFKAMASMAFYNMRDQLSTIMGANIPADGAEIPFTPPLVRLRADVVRLGEERDDQMVALRRIAVELAELDREIAERAAAVEEIYAPMHGDDIEGFYEGLDVETRLPEGDSLEEMQGHALYKRTRIQQRGEETMSMIKDVEISLKAKQDRLRELESGTGSAWLTHWRANVEEGDTMEMGEPENVFLYNLLSEYAPLNKEETPLTQEEYDEFKLMMDEMRSAFGQNIGDDVIMNLTSFESRETQVLMTIMASVETVVRSVKDQLVGASGPLAVFVPGPPKAPLTPVAAKDEEPQYRFNKTTYERTILATLGDTLHSTYTGSSQIPTEFKDVYNQLVLINKISRCGLNPRLWLKECGETIRGVVLDILRAWEQNGQRALTADELCATFDPRYRFAPTVLDFHSAYHLDLRPRQDAPASADGAVNTMVSTDEEEPTLEDNDDDDYGEDLYS